MYIDEEDLFNFSFCPNKLCKEKIDEIKNSVEYAYLIDFFDSLWRNLSSDIKYETKLKLNNVISDYKLIM